MDGYILQRDEKETDLRSESSKEKQVSKGIEKYENEMK
jgi:hypothetical protein